MLTRESRVLTIVATTVALLLPGLAGADVIPPEQGACELKKPGDSCQLPTGSRTTATGVCVSSTCAKRLPDGGSTSSPCLLCQVSAFDGGPRPTADGTVKPAADGSTKPPSTKDESGCTVGGQRARAFGPWFLALGVCCLLLVLGRRRRS